MPSATVTFNGRITLPSHVCKQLGLKTGDSVDFVEIGKGKFAIRHCSGASSDGASDIPEVDAGAAGEEMNELRSLA
jgi:AbrB family looped-hinge helix DNA binding protein